MRAKRADRSDDAPEAAELMRLVVLLDARRHPREHVPGIFRDDEAEAA
ncbi:hypothetical protein [Streptomyces sp. H72]